MKTRLVIYDFDGTIFRSPDKEAGKKLYLEKTGNIFPCQGWWGRMESLSPPIVPQTPDPSWYFSHTINNIQSDQASPETKLVLMTGRPYHLRSRVLELLDNQGLIFDGYFFSAQVDSKGNTTAEIKKNYILKLLEENYESLEIHEDRIDQIAEFIKFSKELRSLYPSIKKILIHDAVNTNIHNL
jgi:hypothetical protein